MTGVVDCVEIAALTQLDVASVQEIVRVRCNDNRDEANRAVAQFFEGTGPFMEVMEWMSGSGKSKSRKVWPPPRSPASAALRPLAPCCRTARSPPPRPKWRSSGAVN